ncbi:MAG TPA: TolC family protein [Spirochaetia bacterium]|nr:TolC family protein [Spirochaetia bacterium]
MRAQLALAIIVTAQLLASSAPTTLADSFTEDQAVERGEATSRDLAYESAILSARELSFGLGIREYFPHFSLGYDENSTVTLGAPDTRGKSLSLTVTQPLLRGGTRGYERGLARLDLALARDDLEQKYRALECDLRRMFESIIVAEMKRNILVRTIDVARQNIEILQTQVRLGVALELDHAQAQLERVSLEIALSETESAVEDLRYQMKKLLSLEPSASLELLGGLNQGYGGLDLSGMEETLFSMAAGYSPDLKRQGVVVQKASVQVKVATFPFVPDIDLEVCAAFTGEEFPLRNPLYSGKLMFSFAIPESPTTYTGGATMSPGRDRGGSMAIKTSPFENISAWVDRKTAILSLDAERRKKEEALQDLRFQVNRLMAAYSQAKRSIELAQRKLDVQRRKEAILRRQMDLGISTRIEYLQSAIETASAEIALNDSFLQLLERERDWESLLGLRPGGLEAIGLRGRGALK